MLNALSTEIMSIKGSKGIPPTPDSSNSLNTFFCGRLYWFCTFQKMWLKLNWNWPVPYHPLGTCQAQCKASRHLRFKMSLHFSNNTSWLPNKSSILPFSVDNPTYRCQNNWSLNASSCYLFSSNKLTWHEAGDYCRTQGASLLILNNAKEWVCISTQLYATLIQ